MYERIKQEINSQIRGNLTGLINAGVMKQVLLDMVDSIEKGTVVEIYTLGESNYNATVDYRNWDDYQVFSVNDELVWKVEGDIDEGYWFETATYWYRMDGAGYRRETKKTIDQAENNAKSYTNQKITQLSGSLSATDYQINSSSIARDTHLQDQIDTLNSGLSQEIYDRGQAFNTLKDWVIDNYPTKTDVDSTYYKSGSNADLGNSATDNLLVRGNLTVEGSVVQTHEEDVQIKDKYVEIASGSRNHDEANGAGFEIMGASASMVYNSADDTLNFNKEIVAPYFHGTASVASDIQDDGVIATALLDIYQKVTPIVTSGSLESATYTLNGQAIKTVDSRINTSYSTVTLATGSSAAEGYEHSAFIKCTVNTTFDLNNLPSPSSADYRIQGGDAWGNPYGASGSVNIAAGETLGMTWIVTGTGLVITDLKRLQ